MNKEFNSTSAHQAHSSTHLIFLLASLLAVFLVACVTQKGEKDTDHVYEYIPITADEVAKYLDAKMTGDSIEVEWYSISDHKPTHVRLYDRDGQLVYTEKNPTLNLGKNWNVDMSDYVQDEQYQLFVQLDNGTQLQTWVSRE